MVTEEKLIKKMLLKKTSLRLFKNLNLGLSSISGVNNSGKKTLYHRGSGVKRNLRIIDFNKYICNVPALVLSTEYDPNRTALICLIAYSNGAISYVLSVSGVNPGSIISTIAKKASFIGGADSAPLNAFKPGVYINNLEVISHTAATYVRCGGSFAKLVSLVGENLAIIKLKSKVLLSVNSKNIATLGVLSAPFRLSYRSAGVRRRLGRRPHVRGVAMNPIDHPHGGGQGKTSGGRPSVTP